MIYAHLGNNSFIYTLYPLVINDNMGEAKKKKLRQGNGVKEFFTRVLGKYIDLGDAGGNTTKIFLLLTPPHWHTEESSN